MRSRTIGFLLLLITAFVWGTTFVAQRLGSNYVGTFTFNASRFLLSGIILGTFYSLSLITKKGQKKKLTIKQKLLVLGVGIALFFGSVLLQLGIELSGSASKSAFISSLYIIFVPIVGLLFKRKTSLFIIPIIVIAVIGTGMVSITEGFNLCFGDFLTFLATLGFTFQIVFISVLSDSIEPLRLCSIEFLIVGGLSLILMLFFELDQLDTYEQAVPSILYAALLSGCIGYLLQIIGQRVINETVASLILSLESVFGLLGGLILLDESLTIIQWIGCALILVAIALSQVNWSKIFRKGKIND